MALTLEIVIFEFIPVLAGAIALVFGVQTLFTMQNTGKERIKARIFLNFKLFKEVLFFMFAGIFLLFLSTILHVFEILTGQWQPVTEVLKTIFWVFTAYATIQFRNLMHTSNAKKRK
ncbi:MAG: hypothetical protein GOV15_01060 [Candidatus Diapherotrites archaeon]|nr:hypothetical protein [Candidatus Diapherotrites archaeon]